MTGSNRLCVADHGGILRCSVCWLWELIATATPIVFHPHEEFLATSRNPYNSPRRSVVLLAGTRLYEDRSSVALPQVLVGTTLTGPCKLMVGDPLLYCKSTPSLINPALRQPRHLLATTSSFWPCQTGFFLQHAVHSHQPPRAHPRCPFSQSHKHSVQASVAAPQPYCSDPRPRPAIASQSRDVPLKLQHAALYHRAASSPARLPRRPSRAKHPAPLSRPPNMPLVAL